MNLLLFYCSFWTLSETREMQTMVAGAVTELLRKWQWKSYQGMAQDRSRAPDTVR